jgi:4-hydroxy-tetrahydrodipicolinate synthase
MHRLLHIIHDAPNPCAMFRGSITALVTPFDAGGGVDLDAFCRLVDRQVGAGSHGVVPCGTTGEASTLSHEEHRAVVEACVRRVAGRIPVIAGAGSNATSETVELARFAKTIGADAVLVATGYYNRPGQEGLARHFETLAEAVQIPCFVYNIPGRAIVDIRPETLARIARHPNMIGIKDATGDISRVAWQRELCGTGFIQLSGDDGSALGHLAHGGHGCISVTSNIAPALCAKMQEHALGGDFAAALAINEKLSALHRLLFVEPSPGPVKHALSRLGLCRPDVRLPITECSDSGKAQIDAALAAAGIEGAS